MWGREHLPWLSFDAEWLHAWFPVRKTWRIRTEPCSLTSCCFLSKGTSLGLTLLSLVLVQTGSCINSYREAFFILPELAGCARPGCVHVCLRHGGFLLAASTREKEACETQVEKPKHRIMPYN